MTLPGHRQYRKLHLYNVENGEECVSGGVQIRSDFKILDATIMKWNKFHTDDPQILSCHGTKFNRHGYMAPGICASMEYHYIGIYPDISHYNILAKRHSIWKAGFVALITYRAKLTLAH
jgi:hypothetical protein